MVQSGESHDIYVEEVAAYVRRATGVDPELRCNGVAGVVFWRFEGDVSAVVQAWMEERRALLGEPVWP